jgi:hypothetical protein
MKQSLRRANVKWFSDKQKTTKHKARRRTPMQLVSLRLHDLAKIFRHRYGIVLPDDDAGREDLEIAINHLANLARPRKHIANWISLWAPWLTAAEQADMVGSALAIPQHYKADGLAWRLRLKAEERRMLGVTTIGAIDENKAARTKRRKRLDRERKANARRSKGSKPRKAYEAGSIQQAMPWIEEGISRATWYRKRKERETDETSPATA